MYFPSPPESAPEPISVKQLVYRLKDVVSISVGTQWVVGELSNVKYHSGGHVYFTLKDEEAEIYCAFFRSAVARCSIRLQEGMKVHVQGEASVYVARGQLQLIIKQVRPAGLGDLQARFLQLKEKLRRQGLFDAARKRKIPAFPQAIGIVTSPTGAVIQDIRHVLKRRAPWVKAYLLPVRVQGPGAEHEIAAAIRAWSRAPQNGLPPVDVLIVGRGGGSIEDLWNFNEEVVARAIFDSAVPIISAVGHETDFTIADFVADLRAPTPTAAAELATPDGPEILRKLDRMQSTLHAAARHALNRAQLRLDVYERGKLLDADSLLAPYAQQLDDLEDDLTATVQERLQNAHLYLDRLAHQLQLRHPIHLNRERARQLDALATRLSHATATRLTDLNSRLTLLATRLSAHSPEHTLRRGYALVTGADKKLIRHTTDAPPGTPLTIRLADGEIIAKTTESQSPDVSSE